MTPDAGDDGITKQGRSAEPGWLFAEVDLAPACGGFGK